MGKFISALKESADVFSENPKLILPKLLVALAYSAVMVFGVKFILDYITDQNAAMLASAIAVLVIDLASLALDTVVNLMFPLLVKQAREGKKVSFSAALAGVSSGFLRTLMPTMVVLLLIAGLSLAWAFIYAFAFGGSIDPAAPDFIVFLIPVGAIILAASFLFYIIYPVSALESRTIGSTLSRTMKFALSKPIEVAKGLLVSIVLSGLSVVIAIALNYVPESQALLFWFAFLVVRFLTAYFATFTYIINPVFYFHYAAGGTPVNAGPANGKNK